MGELYDAPNQQVVRADGSGPWEEGTGGSTPAEQPAPQAQAATQDTERPAQQEARPAQQEARPADKPAGRRKPSDREGPPA